VTEPRLALTFRDPIASLSCPPGQTDFQEPPVRTNHETYADIRGFRRAQATDLAGYAQLLPDPGSAHDS